MQSSATQSSALLSKAHELLQSTGLDSRDIIRTWFFIDDITDWYSEFNEARDLFFLMRRKDAHVLLPASTGIGVAANTDGETVSLDLWAARPRTASASVDSVRPPEQEEHQPTAAALAALLSCVP